MTEPIPFRGVRKVIADRMTQSLAATAQLTYHASADMSAIMEAVPAWKAAGRACGLQDCLLHALTRTLQRHPLLNATCGENSYRPAEEVRVSLALSSPSGLVSPVLPPLEGLSIDAIAVVRKRLVTRAMAGELKVGDFKGGTFTLSNLGLTAVEYFTPILNFPQVAILGVGRIMTGVAHDADGTLRMSRRLPLSLTADHRVVDGTPAGQFLTDLVEALQALTWPDA